MCLGSCHGLPSFPLGTACWPCRQRKVKCDNRSPCENCVKREHPQLCSYKPNRSTGGKQSIASDSGESKKRAHSPDAHAERSVSNEAGDNIRAYGGFALPHRAASGQVLLSDPGSAEPEPADTSRYLGQNSIPALLREQSSPNEPQQGVDTIRQDMRSILGLDNSAPFPLMSSRHLNKLTQDIITELPSDREVMKYVLCLGLRARHDGRLCSHT